MTRSRGGHFIRGGTISCLAAAVCLAGIHTSGADEQPLAERAAVETKSVIVTGTSDTFGVAREAIANAEEATGQRYRVFVMGKRPSDQQVSSARVMLDTLLERLARSPTAAADGEDPAQGFDPATDIAILLDQEGRTIAMRVPYALERELGLDATTINRDLIDTAFVPRVMDGQYAEGLADLVDATQAWLAEQRQKKAARAERSRLFRTRTLPLSAAAVAASVLAGAVILARVRRNRRLSAAREKLASFKASVMQLSDLLDRQQERHRMLPHTDEDFVTPMEGLTRETYDATAAAIRRYREGWLRLMDVWERAEERLAVAGLFDTKASEETLQLLSTAEAQPPLDEVVSACEAPLDLLEQAHEAARASADAVTSRAAEIMAEIEPLDPGVFPVGPLRERRAAIAAMVEAARTSLETDPLAASGQFAHAADDCRRLVDDVEHCRAINDRVVEAGRRAEKAHATVAERRREGWLLAEPGAEPDGLLSRADTARARAAEILAAGELAAAENQVATAEDLLNEAESLLVRIIDARDRVQQLLPTLRSLLSGLRESRPLAVAAVETLAARYAAAAFDDVAMAVDHADVAVQRADGLLEQAEAAAEQQHFFRTIVLAEEAERQLAAADAGRQSIHRRLTDLDELARQLPGRLQSVHGGVRRLLERLARQQTDRIRANEHGREAEELLRQAMAAAEAVRPDPREVRNLLAAAEEASTRATELADEDERLARQAQAELAEADAFLRRAAAWYEEGLSADVGPAEALLTRARGELAAGRYEEAIRAAADAMRSAREAYAAANAAAERRRLQRQEAIRRRQLQESFERLSRGAGPWVISLPSGPVAGPNPWRSIPGQRSSGGSGGGSDSFGNGASRPASPQWTSRTAERGW